MNLSHDFFNLLRGFLAGDRSLDAVHDWLMLNAQAVVDADDAALLEATGRAWIAWCEFDAEHVDAESAREMLMDLAPPPADSTILAHTIEGRAKVI